MPSTWGSYDGDNWNVGTALQTDARRRRFVLIDGVKQALWQDDGTGTAPDLLKRQKYTQFDGSTSELAYTTYSGHGTASEVSASGYLQLTSLTNGYWAAATERPSIASFDIQTSNVPRPPDQELRIVGKLVYMDTPSDNCEAGVCIYIDTDTAYILACAPNGSNYDLHVHKRIAGSWTGSLETSAPSLSVTLDGSTDAVYLRIVWDENAQTLAFSYSTDYQRTYTTFHTETSISNSWNNAGCFSHIISPETGTLTARFDMFRVDTMRPGICCLHPPEETATEIDLGEMAPSMSGMDIVLDDYQATEGVSFFGQLFAPARWDSARHTRIATEAGISQHTQIDGDSTTIDLADGTGWSSGYGYLGRDTFYYSGVSTAQLTGVQFGLFPCVGATSFGNTYHVPRSDATEAIPSCSQQPMTLIGRRVALYVTTKNHVTGEWENGGNEKLLWCGRISEGITHEGSTRRWRLTCMSILEDFRRQVGTRFRESEIYGISLPMDRKTTAPYAPCGPHFRVVASYNGNGSSAYEAHTIELDEWFYESYHQLMRAIETAINGASWLTVSDWEFNFQWVGEGAPVQARVRPLTSAGREIEWFQVYIEPVNQFQQLWPFAPLGFTVGRQTERIVFTGNFDATFDPARWIIVEGEGSPYASFCLTRMGDMGNESYKTVIRVKDGGAFWADQGDHQNTRAWAWITDKPIQEGWPEEISVFLQYSAIYDEESGDGLDNATQYTGYQYRALEIEAALVHVNGEPSNNYGIPYLGHRVGEDPIKIKQCYMPVVDQYRTASAPATNTRPRGPFELLLHLLCSTGAGTNGNYDLLPPSLGIGMQSDLVDTQSFIDADHRVAGVGLDDRSFYPMISPESFDDRRERECKLFSHALAWKDGKITAVAMLAPAIDSYDVTLDDTNIVLNDRPDIDAPTSTVVNRHKISFNYQHDSADPKPKTIINISDIDSIENLALTKEITLEHPGLRLGTTGTDILAIERNMARRLLRLPSQVMSVNLMPALLNRVFAGDIVKFESDYVVDPAGTGTYGVSIFATILGASWNHANDIGQASMMLHSRFADWGSPWAPSALVDKTATDGGWDSTNYRLTLVAAQWGESGDSDDGAAFTTGDNVRIVNRDAATGDRSATNWTAVVANDYEEDGANILTLQTVTLTGWDTTGATEYVVIPDDYGSGAESDFSGRAVHMADGTTEYLSGNVNAQRYG